MQGERYCNMGSPVAWTRMVQRRAGDSRNRRYRTADGSVVPMKAGNAAGGKGPWFRTDAGSGEDRRLGELSTPDGVRKLQAALRAKAKAEPGYRFYALYDKLYRADVLARSYVRCRANKVAPGGSPRDLRSVRCYSICTCAASFWGGSVGRNAAVRPQGW